MIAGRKLWLLLFFIAGCSMIAGAQEDEWWRRHFQYLIYSPRYFGPNALPIPELKSGRIGSRWEVELRGEYHFNPGDPTKDLFARLFIPIANGRAGIEVYGVINETYRMSDAILAERHAIAPEPPIACNGDLIVCASYQILRNDDWFDLSASGTLKTASGNRVHDARYTDAAAYWFEATAGRDLLRNHDATAFLRLQVMGGFYCWMTNNTRHRQNDALLYGAGISGRVKAVSASVDCSGYHGYLKNGDNPVALRTRFDFEYRKNILSLGFRHGMRDNRYNSYTIGYIRCF